MGTQKSWEDNYATACANVLEQSRYAYLAEAEGDEENAEACWDATRSMQADADFLGTVVDKFHDGTYSTWVESLSSV